MKVSVIFGPPGTGKTSELLRRVNVALASGIEPERIAYVSFTKAAVEEAVDRAVAQFKYTRKQFRWFRTLHSMCFGALGLGRDAMLTDYTHFAGGSGLRFSKAYGEDQARGTSDGDQFLTGHNLMAATGLTYEQVQKAYDLKLGAFRFGRIQQMLLDYKKQMNLIEYQDLLTQYIRQCQPLPVDIAFVDEAQDLTPAQWAVVNHAFCSVNELCIAGDDDQAIYQWAGADPLRMLIIDSEKTVLSKSYRLGARHVSFAKAIAARIKKRQRKDWGPADEAKLGEIHHWWSWRDLDLAPGQSWLVLARANQFLPPLAEELESRGLTYTWCGSPRIKQQDAKLFANWKKMEAGAAIPVAHAMQLLNASGNIRSIALRTGSMISMADPGMNDVRWLSAWSRRKVQYFERVLARYGRIEDLPSVVTLTTIHQAKGTEADNVVLCPDTTPATLTRGDAEHRVFYVAATRARKRLFLLRPAHEHFYRVP